MSTKPVERDFGIELTRDPRRRMLELARSLDRFGRHAEEFLCREMDQLQRAMEEFEGEKAAWRRQLRRESSQLAAQRDELQRLIAATAETATPGLQDRIRKQRDIAEATARRSNDAPLKLLVQPRNTSASQLGVLLFEISKLNRDMRGSGLRFEVADVRLPKKRLLRRLDDPDSNADIFELHGFPTVPFKARGSHVKLDEDLTDRIEDWIAFKARLLQSSLADGDLRSTFEKGRATERDADKRAFMREATRRPEEIPSRELEPFGVSGGALVGNSPVDAVRQQVLRLESCFERLTADSGLRIQVFT